MFAIPTSGPDPAVTPGPEPDEATDEATRDVVEDAPEGVAEAPTAEDDGAAGDAVAAEAPATTEDDEVAEPAPAEQEPEPHEPVAEVEEPAAEDPTAEDPTAEEPVVREAPVEDSGLLWGTAARETPVPVEEPEVVEPEPEPAREPVPPVPQPPVARPVPGPRARVERPAPAERPVPAERPSPADLGADATAAAGSRAAAGRDRRGRRRGRRLLVGLLVLVVLAAAAVVVGLRVQRANDPTVAEQVPDAQLPDVPAPAPVLAALASDAPVPDPTALAAAVDPLLAAPALGGDVGVQVVDVADGTVLLDQRATDPVPPASTAKLLTAAAALTTLDPAATLTTTVVAGSSPGEVVLVGGGDVTLSTAERSAVYPGAPTIADLAAQVTAALPAGTQVSRVVVDGSLYTGPAVSPDWQSGDAPSTYAAPVTAVAVDGARVRPGANPRSATPDLDAGHALAQALGAPRATVVQGDAPAGAATLGTVHSAPVSRLVEQALRGSDNLLAESLGRQVAIARGLPASFAGTAQAVPAALTQAGLDVTGVTLVDGSGLSYTDRVPPRLLVDIVRGAATGSLGEAGDLLAGLPVAGWDGTLFDRGDADPATQPGAVRAKTGTLLGVNALAGTVLTADGRLLAFAVVADRASPSLTAAEAALDEVASALAACGCR